MTAPCGCGNLAARITQHREGRGSQLCREHGLVRLVYAERHEDIHEAIVREKRIKDWHRQWKLRLVRKANPYGRDLFEDINA